MMIVPSMPSPVSFCVLLFTAGSASLILNAAQPLAPKQNSSNPSINASLADVQLASSSNLSHLIIQCDPSQYGHDLNYASCHEAYNQIPHVIPEMTWGPRTQGQWTINLPWRVYSFDGLCAINVNSRSGIAVSDTASWYDIAQAASEVLQRCVQPDNSGGSLKNLGQKTNLIVTVLSYAPHVHCSVSSSLPPSDYACSEVRSTMSASEEMQKFGPVEIPGVEVGLPQTWLASGSARLGSCVVVVNTRGPLDTASWFEMWAGAGAVGAICVKRGLVGISTGQGVLGGIFVIVKGTA